jgi:hypothetical protein
MAKELIVIVACKCVDSFSELTLYQDIEEAKLRVFQKLDSPEQPGYRGLRPFLTGIDDKTFGEHRQRYISYSTCLLTCLLKLSRMARPVRSSRNVFWRFFV